VAGGHPAKCYGLLLDAGVSRNKACTLLARPALSLDTRRPAVLAGAILPGASLRSLYFSVLLAALACLPLPSAARAQADSAAVPGPIVDVPLVPQGTRLRVTDAGGTQHLGRFWYLRSDTLWLISETDGRSGVPLTGGERIETTRGHRREAWSTGGLLAGAALGLLASQLNGSDDGPSGSARNTSEAVYAVAAGAVIGGLTGWFLAPQRWKRVEVPPPAVLPPPPAATGGAAAGTRR
jgi:hypothetical protein